MIKIEDIVSGAFVYYEDAKGILFEDKEQDFFSCYWYENPELDSYGIGFVPRDETHAGESKKALAAIFSKEGWLSQPESTQIIKPLSNLDEIRCWSMCNPGHDNALKIIYAHLFEVDNEQNKS